MQEQRLAATSSSIHQKAQPSKGYSILRKKHKKEKVWPAFWMKDI
jgi:hypothetical protein